MMSNPTTANDDSVVEREQSAEATAPSGVVGSKSTQRLTQLSELVEPICAAHGVELVQLRWMSERGGSLLRVFIDRISLPDDSATEVSSEDAAKTLMAEGSGVTVEDCTRVSRDFSTALDVHEELVPGKYRLEVSSPGLDRPLVKLSDFEKFKGLEAKIKTSMPVESEHDPAGRRSFQGTLLGVDGDLVSIEVDGKHHAVPHSLINKANLVYRF